MNVDLHEFVPYPITSAEPPGHACKGGCACATCSLQKGDRAAHYQTRDRRRPAGIRQREHELTEALTAARSLQARLEMLGDRPDDVRAIHGLRDRLAADVAALAPEGGR